MSLWNTIKQELDGPFEAVRKGLSDAFDLAEDLTRKGRVKLEVQAAKSDIRNQMTELGGRVHQLAVEDGETDIVGDKTVKSIFKKIDQLEKKIQKKEEELQAEDSKKS
jgi:virulence-associated protein VapD